MERPVSLQEKEDEKLRAFHNRPDVTHHHLHVATMTQLARESLPTTPTCQVGLGQGFDLPVGSGGEDFSQRAFSGAGTLITNNKTTTQSEKLKVPSQARCCAIDPHLDGFNDLQAVVDSRRRHQSDEQVLKVAVSVPF